MRELISSGLIRL